MLDSFMLECSTLTLERALEIRKKYLKSRRAGSSAWTIRELQMLQRITFAGKGIVSCRTGASGSAVSLRWPLRKVEHFPHSLSLALVWVCASQLVENIEVFSSLLKSDSRERKWFECARARKKKVDAVEQQAAEPLPDKLLCVCARWWRNEPQSMTAEESR